MSVSKASSSKPSVKENKKLYRLRSLLLLVALSTLLLPLASILYFRFYENELVRQTELELIAQSAVISAVYREFLNNQIKYKSAYGISTKSSLTKSRDDYYTPVTASIDLSQQRVLPRRKNAKSVYNLPDNYAINAGVQLQQILKNSQQVTLAGIRVLDFNGIVVAGRNERGFSLAHVHEVKQALQGKYSSVIRQRISDEAPPPIASISRGTGIRVFTAFPIVDGNRLYGVVYLSRTPQNILKHLYAVTGRVLIATAIVLIVTLLLAFFVSSRIVRPIKQLTDQAKKLAQGELITVNALDKPGTYEVSRLSHSFATMSQTLHQRSDYIRQFAAHVSHEFKTPLTAIQGALELLQDHIDDMPTEQRQKFLNNLQSDTQRLEKLVTRLLELAKADAMQASDESTDLALNLERFKRRYQDKSLQIVITPDHYPTKVAIASDVLETIFTNLFENSLQHHANSIDIDISHKGQYLKLYLHDNGDGISNANADRIFTPFFTTRRNQGGTGLGLDIVTSLLQTWKGDIQLQTVEKGTAFVIRIRCA